MRKHRLEIKRGPRGLTFYIDGSLQFDTCDEHIYHESLVLPAAGLGVYRNDKAPQALILGGGDGLSLRELLRFPAYKKIDLVDYDHGVIHFAKNIFRPWNKDAFSDTRVSVAIQDAKDYLSESKKKYDLIVADFTFPDTLVGCGLFTADFFALIKKHLYRQGIFALNAVSPSFSSPAFWSIYKTLLAVNLYPKPMHVTIPSFLSHGYGEWGFCVASGIPITLRELKKIAIPSGIKYLTKKTLLGTMQFPVHFVNPGFALGKIIKEPGDLLCLLNLSEPRYGPDEKIIDFSLRFSSQQLRQALSLDQDILMSAIACEWQAWVMDLLRSFDWLSFLQEAEKIFKDLPDRYYEEFKRFKKELPQLLKENVFNFERAYQCFALLIILIILVNLAYPDNAFAKGGFGHGSYYHSDSEYSEPVLTAPVAPSLFHGRTFQLPSLDTVITDMQGRIYPQKNINYLADQGGKRVKERFSYALSDTLFLTKSSMPYTMISSTPYSYKIERHRFVLIEDGASEQLFEFAPDEDVIQSYQQNLTLQRSAIEKTLADYQKWLAWVAPVKNISGDATAEMLELKNIQSIKNVLFAADKDFPGRKTLSDNPYPSFKLAPGVYLTRDTAILFRQASGQWACYPYPGFSTVSTITTLKPTESLNKFVANIIQWNLTRLPSSHPCRMLLEQIYR